ncbi:MAG: hypothetical protein IKQ06_02300 [Bacilli bacterium]|nr:hypothetical protein [Bacilli bacterium]
MRSDRKRTILFIIILLVMSMGIGYAFLTTTLSIDGTSDIDSSSWDVHFENVQVQSGAVTGSQVITPATISADGQTVSYHIKLNEPGDNYTFKIDVVNDGSLSAKISNILFKINGEDATMAPSYLAQYVVYEDYSPVTISQIINPGETKTLKSGIHYREDINPSDLPTEDTSLTISFGLVYDQMSSSGYVYSYNSSADIGDSILSNGTFYNDLGFSIFDSRFGSSIRYKTTNLIIEELALCFEYDNDYFCLNPSSDGSTYDSNKEIMLSAFGSSNCTEYSGSRFFCYGPSSTIGSYVDGSVSSVDINRSGCYINSDGSHECGMIGRL